MREFPAGVSVATVEADGERLGLTLATLVSLSLEPPLVGFAVRQDAAIHEPLKRSRAFGVSLLSGGQEDLAQHFARGVPPIAMWVGIDLLEEEGPPLLSGAVGWLRGTVVAEHSAGSHTFFVGEVDSAARGDAGRALVYRRGGYAPS